MRIKLALVCLSWWAGIRLGAGVPLPLQPQQGQPGAVPAGVLSYIVDARSLDTRIGAFILEWPDDAAEFAGRLQVEAGQNLNNNPNTWRKVLEGAPVANLLVDGERLIENRVEFTPTQAKYWRLTWDGAAPSFALTGVQAEPATGQSGIKRSALAVNGKPAAGKPGEFEFDLGAAVPVDRVNLQLPDRNSIVRVDLQSRAAPSDAWQPAVSHGFYRLETRNGEMRNGPVAIAPTAHRYWLARLDEHGGERTNLPPRLQVEWIPQTLPKASWLWVVLAVGIALLLALIYRWLAPRRRSSP